MSRIVVATPPVRTVLVTGGAGFIGSAVVRLLLADGRTRVVNLDKLTYAASPTALRDVRQGPRYRFVEGDIADRALVGELLAAERVEAIIHLAAETHVDRSIDGPAAFIQTNIVGTFALLEVVRDHWLALLPEAKARFRFQHVSTDEVFGDLPLDGGFFDETSPYRPSSPYSASKAASDHLVRAWYATHGLPVLVTNCSNNYGPHQAYEKLIPLMTLKALRGELLPVYGTGANVRDWLHVDDHAAALLAVLDRGMIGATYAIGAREEHANIAIVARICDLLDARAPLPHVRRRSLIRFVTDRPGHDTRYAIDPSRLERDLGWRPAVDFNTGLAATVDWYCKNEVELLAVNALLERQGRTL